jgi:hypothetical protein
MADCVGVRSSRYYGRLPTGFRTRPGVPAESGVRLVG